MQGQDLASLGTLDFYAIRSHDGKWFRAKGYSGRGDNWVDDVKSAKIYQRTRSARSVVTYYAKAWPSRPVPKLVHFTAQAVEVFDEEERIAKQKEREKKRKEQEKVRAAKEALERAEADLVAAQARVARLRVS